MSSPFRVRDRLTGIWKSISVKLAIAFESKSLIVDDSEFINQELTRSYCKMAGKRGELRKIFEWMNAHPGLAEVASHNDLEEGLFSFLIQETKFARVIRRYEIENNLEERDLGDNDIKSILLYGRGIRCILRQDNDELVEFAYSVGNSTQMPIIPEFISFYPGSETVGRVLDELSDYFQEEAVNPIRAGEIREIHGLLNPPLRIWLMQGDERKHACDEWSTRIPEDPAYPLIFVDIPDTNGYFCWEPECNELICQRYPQEIAKPSESTSCFYLPPDPSSLPISADAASLCLRASRRIAQYQEEENGSHLAIGTHLVLVNMEIWTDPSTWVQEDQEIIDDNYRFLLQCSYIKGAKQWVSDELFFRDNDPHQIAFDWSLRKPEGPASDPELDEIGFEEHYPSTEELLKDIDWLIVTKVVSKALEACADNEIVEQLRTDYSKTDEQE